MSVIGKTDESKRAMCLNRVEDKKLQWQNQKLERQRKASIQHSYAERNELQLMLKQIDNPRGGHSVTKTTPQGKQTPSFTRSPKELWNMAILKTLHQSTTKPKHFAGHRLGLLHPEDVGHTSAKAFSKDDNDGQVQTKLSMKNGRKLSITTFSGYNSSIMKNRRTRRLSSAPDPEIQSYLDLDMSTSDSELARSMNWKDYDDVISLEQSMTRSSCRSRRRRESTGSNITIKTPTQLEKEVQDTLNSNLTPAVIEARTRLRKHGKPETSRGYTPDFFHRMDDMVTSPRSRFMKDERYGHEVMPQDADSSDESINDAKSGKNFPPLTAFIRLPHPSLDEKPYAGDEEKNSPQRRSATVSPLRKTKTPKPSKKSSVRWSFTTEDLPTDEKSSKRNKDTVSSDVRRSLPLIDADKTSPRSKTSSAASTPRTDDIKSTKEKEKKKTGKESWRLVKAKFNSKKLNDDSKKLNEESKKNENGPQERKNLPLKNIRETPTWKKKLKECRYLRIYDAKLGDENTDCDEF